MEVILSIVHWLCGIGVFLSNVAVWIGVYWEGDGKSKEIQAKGWQLLLKGLAAEAAFGFMLFAADAALGNTQLSKIIMLEQRLAARTLSNTQLAGIEKKASRFPGQVFDTIPYWDDEESIALGKRISVALRAANWRVGNPPEVGVLIGVVIGVRVLVYADSSIKTHDAAEELVAALKGADIASAMAPNDMFSSHPVARSDRILIQIGIKP